MILSALREQTRPQHQRLEAQLDIFNQIQSLDRYRSLLERLYGFYNPVERALSLWNADLWQEKALSRCGKTLLLQRDLDALDSERNHTCLLPLPLCQELPSVSRLGLALGCFYVLEGATLGGQIIARHLYELHQLGPDSGAAFFGGYGSATGRRWKDFGNRLTEYVESGKCPAAEVIAGAQEAFARYEAWVCPRVGHDKCNDTQHQPMKKN